ncbi:SgrR family transcriptional regulator [Salinivibrio kushneri]|uniref:SgrR family transcriptional regulator n=1 Tax=Salinivibrio kushneri TaxID=1908198 RepID=UPI000988E75D|nr:SgrR family transcriptional regulator [Salinivibrio kushneri]OOE49404.1 hypothetical protein BZG10_09695 [Salinivibrio kushneri]
MSGQRLRAQFSRLYHHFNGESTDTTLQAVADILVCTRRNARMVLSKLEEQGWLTWQPSVGRGKLSRLAFLRSEMALREEQAAHWLAQGKMDQALACLDHDSTKLAALIQKQMGPSTQNGRQIVRLPYYRQLETLDPREPLRRSEQHLVGQIFAHLSRVDSPGPRMIDVYLSSPDPRFDHALTLPEAVIRPADRHQAQSSSYQPIGTGPYRVAEKQPHRLVLEAFDDYFGYRALTDEIQIMVFDEAAMCYLTPSTSLTPERLASHQTTLSQKLEMDQGAGYLLLNCRDGLAKQPAWREYLHAKLSSLQLLPRLAHCGMGEYRLFNAYGLMPGWMHHGLSSMSPVVPSPTSLTVAYLSDHPLYPLIAKAIHAHLLEDGIQVKTLALSPTDYFSGQYGRKIDIWLGAMSFGERGQAGLFNWLGTHDLVLSACTDPMLKTIESHTQRWRDTQDDSCAEHLARCLVEHQMVPLFHIWMGVMATPDLQDVASNAVGWFDFKSVWHKPH